MLSLVAKAVGQTHYLLSMDAMIATHTVEIDAEYKEEQDEPIYPQPTEQDKEVKVIGAR